VLSLIVHQHHQRHCGILNETSVRSHLQMPITVSHSHSHSSWLRHKVRHHAPTLIVTHFTLCQCRGWLRASSQWRSVGAIDYSLYDKKQNKETCFSFQSRLRIRTRVQYSIQTFNMAMQACKRNLLRKRGVVPAYAILSNEPPPTAFWHLE